MKQWGKKLAAVVGCALILAGLYGVFATGDKLFGLGVVLLGAVCCAPAALIGKKVMLGGALAALVLLAAFSPRAATGQTGPQTILVAEASAVSKAAITSPETLPSALAVGFAPSAPLTFVPAPLPSYPPTSLSTPAPAPAQPQGDMVWVSRTGTKYHSSQSCSNMKSPLSMTQEDAIAAGRAACSKCW